MGAGVQLLGLLQRFEDPLQGVLGDPGAQVDDADLDAGGRFLDPDADRILLPGELEPVLDELLEDAEGGDAVECREHRPAGTLHMDPWRDPGDLLGDVDHVGVLGEARLDHALEAGHEPSESLRAHDQRAEHLLPLIRGARPLGKGLRHPEDHGDGGSELVAEPAHELVAPGGAFEQCLLCQLELA